MKNRPDELDYYSEQYKRIETLNAEYPGSVRFDGFGPDMDEWYTNIGIVLSTSEFESFHLTIADGAASAAMPVLLNWPGADLIYPDNWLSGTTDEMVSSILSNNVTSDEAQSYVNSNFGQSELLQDFVGLLELTISNKVSLT